jgi:hypothetical protein
MPTPPLLLAATINAVSPEFNHGIKIKGYVW